MRRRTQAEMDDLVREAGFEKTRMGSINGACSRCRSRAACLDSPW